MFKTVANEVWAFDAECVLAPIAGQVLYGLSDALINCEVIEGMWQCNEATEDDSNGDVKGIVQYNIRDVLRAYFVWLRIAYLSKCFEEVYTRNRNVYKC